LRRSAPLHSGPPPVTALTATCEAVWIMQALCGVEMLPAALMLRPYVSAGGPPTAQTHSGVAILREAGALIDDTTVHPRIARWLEALGAPDIELSVSVRRRDSHLRLVIARRDTVTVAISRCADDLTIEEIGPVGSIRSLYDSIVALCGPPVEPAQFEPITVKSADFVDGLAAVVDGAQSTTAAWGGLGLSAEQRRIVMLAADAPLMEASFAVVIHDARGDHVGLASAAVTDTAEGRVVTGPIRGEDKAWWTQIVPGTVDAGAAALRSLLESVGTTWQGHSRLH
jgi:hypothetical protein